MPIYLTFKIKHTPSLTLSSPFRLTTSKHSLTIVHKSSFLSSASKMQGEREGKDLKKMIEFVDHKSSQRQEKEAARAMNLFYI